MRSTDCKGCSATVHVTDGQLERMIAKLERFPEHCVPESVYRSRLQSCGECSALEYGTTCRYCGCIVQVRAKMKEKLCPSPGGNRWIG